MADADPNNLSDAHTEMPSLKGRKAVITGGTTGIGRAIAVLLAAEGVEIFTCRRDEQHLADGLERINEVGKGSGIALDLGEKDGVDKFFAAAENPALTEPIKDQMYLDNVVFTTGIADAGDHFVVASGEADLACRITHIPKEAFVPA